MANDFRILLSWISARLNEQEIRNLVSMCDVPEGQRAEMIDGISFFDHLIKRDLINERNLGRLKRMLKSLSPQRRDLIKEIQNFENGEFTGNDASFTLTSVRSIPFTRATGRSIPSTPTSDRSIPSTIRYVSRSDVEETCCTVGCPCMMMTCYKYSKIPWSYVGCFVFFLTCFLTVVLLWYANVPKASEAIASNEHVKEAAPYILIGIVVLFIACLFLLYYVRKRLNRQPEHSAITTDEEHGLHEVHTSQLAMSTSRAGTSKINKNRTGSANCKLINREVASDSATEDVDTDQDAISHGSVNFHLPVNA